MKVFTSHSSNDLNVAVQLERTLERSGIDVWLDGSDIRFGVLLRKELQKAISKSRVVMLLWSKSAARSRWVAGEILTAFHMDRFVLPCVLDGTQLPLFLENDVHLDFRRNRARQMNNLCRAIREAPAHANEIPSFRSSQRPEIQRALDQISLIQRKEMARLGASDFAGARRLHALADRAVKKALKKWPLETGFLNEAGFHCKNGYMLKHWDAFQAGRPQKDPLLERAERFFFEALFVNPNDCSAVNGLGNILIFRRELEAAEFFVRRAIALAEKDHLDYSAAKQDLAAILYFAGKQPSWKPNP